MSQADVEVVDSQGDPEEEIPELEGSIEEGEAEDVQMET